MRSRSRDVRSTRREVLRKNQRSLYVRDDRPFPLPNGTQADPRQAWVLPSNEQEK